VLIKGGDVLERSKHIDTVVFDKTGTLTNGEMSVTDIYPVDGVLPDVLLALAAAAESGSEHPIGHAVVHAARQRRLAIAPVEKFEAVAGHGIRAEIQGGVVWVGSRKLLAQAGCPLPWDLEAVAAGREDQGRTAFFVARDGAVQGVLAVADTLKDGARGLVADLHRMAVQVAMITGDNARTAQAIAAQAGIDRVLAEVLPADKAAEVRQLQDQGHVVAMVGDGINDAPALVQADLGLAIGTGTDVAIESSDITLLSNRLDGVATAIRLARQTSASSCKTWAGHSSTTRPPFPLLRSASSTPS
jgi:cation-transporting ATPase V